MTVHAVVPAAGSATRMRGLAKFALPCSARYDTLLGRHVEHLLAVADHVTVATRPQYVDLVRSLVPSERVSVFSMLTETMTETVLRSVQDVDAGRFVLCMPDTYFYGEQPYAALAGSTDPLTLALWPVRDDQRAKLGLVDVTEGRVRAVRDKDPQCSFAHAWGAMAFDRSFLSVLDASMAHVGFGIEPYLQAFPAGVGVVFVDGEYYDCGTAAEYFTLVQRLQSGAAR